MRTTRRGAPTCRAAGSCLTTTPPDIKSSSGVARASPYCSAPSAFIVEKINPWLTPFLIGSGDGVAGHQKLRATAISVGSRGPERRTELYGKWLKGARL